MAATRNSSVIHSIVSRSWAC